MSTQVKNKASYAMKWHRGAAINNRVSFSPAESAQLLGICKNHIYKFLDSGELRSFKLGQRRLINREALDDFRLKLEKLHTTEIRGEGND